MSNDLRAALDDGLGVFQEIVDGLDRGEMSDSDLATLDRLDAALPEIRRRLDGDTAPALPADPYVAQVRAVLANDTTPGENVDLDALRLTMLDELCTRIERAANRLRADAIGLYPEHHTPAEQVAAGVIENEEDEPYGDGPDRRGAREWDAGTIEWAADGIVAALDELDGKPRR